MPRRNRRPQRTAPVGDPGVGAARKLADALVVLRQLEPAHPRFAPKR